MTMEKIAALCLFLTIVTGNPYQIRSLDSSSKFSSLSKRYFPFVRIVGGDDVKPGELPYQVTIQDISFGFPVHFCGGSIVSESWVVTAAHCFDDLDITKPEFFQITSGELSFIESEGHEQMVKLSEIIIHEKYDSWNVANDIALLRLSHPIIFDDFSQPLPLTPKGHLASGQCTVSGWGATKSGGDSSDTLKKATISIMTDQECKDVFEELIDGCMMCAGDVVDGIDACKGDSGGPLMCDDIGSKYLAGLVSWGFGCGETGVPGVYSKTSCFIDWINEHVSQ